MTFDGARPCEFWDSYSRRTVMRHDGIVTAEDSSDEYDPSVLGIVPNGHHYGYCRRCLMPFRWDVARQQWMETTLEDIAFMVKVTMAIEGKQADALRQELDSETPSDYN